MKPSFDVELDALKAAADAMTAELRRVQALNAELLAALKAVQEDDLSINLKFSVQSAVDAAIAKAAAKEGA